MIIGRKIIFVSKKDLPKSHFKQLYIQLLVHFAFQCSSINLKINILIFFLEWGYLKEWEAFQKDFTIMRTLKQCFFITDQTNNPRVHFITDQTSLYI